MHTIILGMTQSGKSSYGKIICRKLRQAGVMTYVLNPLREQGWRCDLQTADPDQMMAACQASKIKKAVFLDEAGQSLARDPRFNYFCAQSRHDGCSVFAISQRLQMVLPDLRTNTTQAVLFRCWYSEAKTLSDQFNEARLLDAAKFRQGEFFLVSAYRPLRKGMLDCRKQKIVSLIELDE